MWQTDSYNFIKYLTPNRIAKNYKKHRKQNTLSFNGHFLTFRRLINDNNNNKI